MKNNISHRKLIGMMGIILGMLSFGGFLFFDKSKLIINNSSLFLVKYFLIIMFINSGIFFLIGGILNLFGVIVPYYSDGITKYERAKIHILSIVLTSPMWLSFYTTIFVMSKTMLWKILGVLMIIYTVWLFYSSAKMIRGKSSNCSS